MMDTILNLGITDAVEEGLARLSGDASFAREAHVRFVHEFGQTVLGAVLDPPHRRASAAMATGSEVPTIRRAAPGRDPRGWGRGGGGRGRPRRGGRRGGGGWAPVPERSARLPNTIACTTTAVPPSSGIPQWRR